MTTEVNTGVEEDHKFRVGDNLRGVIVMLASSAALVGIAFGVMMLLTSPDGWVTRAAVSAANSEAPQVASFGVEDGQ